MEGYLVDDIKNIVTDSRGQSLDSTFVVFDIETTGFSAVNDRITKSVPSRWKWHDHGEVQ